MTWKKKEKAEGHPNAIFLPLNMALIKISCSCFKKSKNSLFTS